MAWHVQGEAEAAVVELEGGGPVVVVVVVAVAVGAAGGEVTQRCTSAEKAVGRSSTSMRVQRGHYHKNRASACTVTVFLTNGCEV
jgi:hypothetical protein